MSSDKQPGSNNPTRSLESLGSRTVAESGGDGRTATPQLVTKSEPSRDSGDLGQSAPHQNQPAEKQEVDTEKGVSDNWDEDPRNPRRWSSSRKWASAAVVSLYTLVS